MLGFWFFVTRLALWLDGKVQDLSRGCVQRCQNELHASGAIIEAARSCVWCRHAVLGGDDPAHDFCEPRRDDTPEELAENEAFFRRQKRDSQVQTALEGATDWELVTGSRSAGDGSWASHVARAELDRRGVTLGDEGVPF